MPDQIVPATAAPAVAARPPGAVSRELEGQWAVVAGRVSRFAPFRGGMRAFVAGADGAEVAVTLFDSVWNLVPFSSTLRAGDAFAAAGRVVEYRGALELQPEIPADVWREP